MTLTASTSATHEGGRPKGILKNHSSSQSPPKLDSHVAEESPPSVQQQHPELDSDAIDKDLTLQNTLQNAGHRRTSSNPRMSASRRQSSNARSVAAEDEDSNPRLKWDEANLYLTEQEKSSTMKIDEPKTPYAKRYDPDEDDETELHTLDADDLMVDELDTITVAARSTRESAIPELELGEPEEAVFQQGDNARLSTEASKGEKQVVVDPEIDDGLGGHGEGSLDPEGQEKHKRFEEMRKKHYEMRDVKGLLGHPEELEALDEDDDAPANSNGAPTMPTRAAAPVANGV